MKKQILTLLLLITVFMVNAQQKNVESILTSGKWYLECTQKKGEHPEHAENKTDEWVLFHKTGVLDEGLYDEVTSSKWIYDKDNNAIKISNEMDILKKIVEISDKKLIVQYVDRLDSDNKSYIVTYTK